MIDLEWKHLKEGNILELVVISFQACFAYCILLSKPEPIVMWVRILQTIEEQEERGRRRISKRRKI
jgi:hypothetical protein